MHSTIEAKIEDMKQDMKRDIDAHIYRQLESFITKITELMNIHRGITSYKQPYNPEGVAFSNSQDFQSNHLHHDPCLLRVEVTKSDGSYPIGWVTQMEHCMASLMS